MPDLQILTAVGTDVGREDIAAVYAWTRGTGPRPNNDTLARVRIVSYPEPTPLLNYLDAMVWDDAALNAVDFD